MLIASVDPHKAKIAIAVWSACVHPSGKRTGTLKSYELIKAPLDSLVDWALYRKRAYDLLVIETPQIYPGERVKDPNDLLDVAKTVGLCHVIAREVIEYRPAQWKGQTPKKIHQKRIKSLLSPSELAILGNMQDQSDVLDAVGIGLKYLGRM